MSPTRLLYAGEDEAVTRLIAQLAPRHGFVLETVSFGQPLLRGIFAPDVLLFDLRLGVDQLRALRADRRTRELSIIAIGDGSNFTETLRAGADLYLRKPLEPGELVESVVSLLPRAA